MIIDFLLLVACTAGLSGESGDQGADSTGMLTDSDTAGLDDYSSSIFTEDFEDGADAWDTPTGSRDCALLQTTGSAAMALYVREADAEMGDEEYCGSEAIRGFDLTSYGSGVVTLTFGTNEEAGHDATVTLYIEEEDHGTLTAEATWIDSARMWAIVEGEGEVSGDGGTLTIDLDDFVGWATDVRLRVSLVLEFSEDERVYGDTVVWFDDVAVQAE